MLDNLKNRNIILASQSPRRRHLLKQLVPDFAEINADIDETLPEGMDPEQSAIALAVKKADFFKDYLNDPKNILITADTLVLINGDILGKPDGYAGAMRMLKTLSGKMHRVVTGVSVNSSDKKITFASWSDVYFKNLTEEEIRYYLDNFRPYDKAGAYGIQEWIGYIGITRIEGSYFNVMGLPIQELYEELSRF